MAQVDNKLLLGILKDLQTDVAGTSSCMDKFEQHLGSFEARQTASTHLERSALAYLASIHESMDELECDMRAARSEMRDVHGRRERVEAR